MNGLFIDSEIFKRQESGRCVPVQSTHSQPWGQWTQLQPTKRGTLHDAPAPCAQRVRAFLVKNDSISCSWLHLLRVWSLLINRGDSQGYRGGYSAVTDFIRAWRSDLGIGAFASAFAQRQRAA